MNTYQEVATNRVRPPAPPARDRKIRLFEEEENDNEKEMLGSDANFGTDPPTRRRKLRADRAAVEPGLAIDPRP